MAQITKSANTLVFSFVYQFENIFFWEKDQHSKAIASPILVICWLMY